MPETAAAQPEVRDVRSSSPAPNPFDCLPVELPSLATGSIAISAMPVVARPEVRMGRADAESGLIWTTTAFMVLFHLGAIAALFFFSWTNLIVAAVLYIFAINWASVWATIACSSTAATCSPAVEYFLAICGTLSLEGGPIGWVGTHRVHHQNSDQ